MFKVKFDEMIIYRGRPSLDKGILGAFYNHFSGRGTMSEGKPLIVRYIQEEKKYIILDGYHRIVKGLLEGKTEFNCILDWFNEEKWWVPPKDQRFILE